VAKKDNTMRLLIAVLAGMTFSVSALALCAPLSAMQKALWDAYKEQPSHIGLVNNGTAVQILTSKDGETWTMIVLTPDGVACTVAAGTDWSGVVKVRRGMEG